MNRNNKLHAMTISAMLCALGILIPIISPIKITLEPASFTLASHVAIFIAMFISPFTAIFVSIGTTIGFLIGGFPIVVVMRAATHIIFVIFGATLLKKFPNIINSIKTALPFSIAISVIHGVCEVLVVLPFYFSNSMTAGYYAKGFITSVILLVGVGTVIHSMIDFYLAQVIWKHVSKAVKIPEHINMNEKYKQSI